VCFSGRVYSGRIVDTHDVVSEGGPGTRRAPYVLQHFSIKDVTHEEGVYPHRTAGSY